MDWIGEEESYLVLDQDANDEGSLDSQDDGEEGVDVDAGEGAGNAVGQTGEVKAVPWHSNAVLHKERSLQKLEHGCWRSITVSRLFDILTRYIVLEWKAGVEAFLKCTPSHAPMPTEHPRPYTMGGMFHPIIRVILLSKGEGCKKYQSVVFLSSHLKLKCYCTQHHHHHLGWIDNEQEWEDEDELSKAAHDGNSAMA